MTRRYVGWILLLAGAIGAGAPLPGVAQTLRWQKRGATLQEAIDHLAAQTGYEVAISRTAAPRLNQRADIEWDGVSFFEAARALVTLYRCQLRASGETRLYLASGTDTPVAETTVEAYRIRCVPVSAAGEGLALFSLLVESDSEMAVEAIAGIGTQWRALDSLSRPVAVAGRPSEPQLLSTLYRRYVTQWQYYLRLELPDEVAPRLREITGELLAYSRVRPVRIEFDLRDRRARSASAEGVAIDLSEWEREGEEISLRARVNWPAQTELIGRGISRNLSPYLVAADGQVLRVADEETTTVEDREPTARNECEQRLVFLSRETPSRLVYEMLLREGPLRSLHFRLQNVPLTSPRADRRADAAGLFDWKGGTLEVRLQLPASVSREGELALGLARQSGRRSGARRWIEAALDSDGICRLEGLRPGTYQLMWRYWPPGEPPFSGSVPMPVTVVAGREVRITLAPAPR